MFSKTDQIQILYEFSMAIGSELDLNKMLRKSIVTVLKKMNCPAGGVHLLNKDSNGIYQAEQIFSIPRNTSKIKEYQAALELIPTGLDDHQLIAFKNSLPLHGQSKPGKFFHIVDLPGMGVVILLKNNNDLDQVFIKSLGPLFSKLAAACQACLTNQELLKHRDNLEVLVQKKSSELVTRNQQLLEKINELTQVEKSLLQSTEILEKIFSTTHFLIAYMDDKFNFTRVNKAYAEAGNHSPDFFIGKNHFDLYPHDENEKIFRQVVSSGEPYNVLGKPFEYPGDPDHNITYWDWTLHPVFNGHEKVVGILLTLLDVTEAKLAEKEKIILEAQLRQAHKMEAIGTLTGGIAHDFNNILAIILGNAELASLYISDDQPAKHNINQVLAASNRAKDLVKRLLTFSRQEKGEKEPFYLCLLIDESMKTLRSTIPKTVKLVVNIPSKCRDNIDDCLMINADRTQIHQLIMNLCVNAVQAMDEEGTLEISVDEVTFKDDTPASYPEIKFGTYEYLTVSDTGHGLDPESIDKIFDPFFTTKEVDKGTGIGLSVVQGIIKNHDGYIFVESEPAKGTTFHMYFPVTSEKKIETKSDETTLFPHPKGNERILFVDDEVMLAEVGKSMLEELGYSVTAHTKSTEALELFQSDPNRFDLVITDQSMPKIQGSELANQLLQLRPDIPIILCTGFSTKVDKKKAKHIGIRKFAMKPLDIKEVARLVRQVLDEVV